MTNQSWIPTGWVGVRDAAKRLGVSDKTIRRRIKDNELRAKLIDSPYGREAWVIDEEQIKTAQQVLDIVEVKQEHELQDVALALAQIIKERDAERDNRFNEQLEQFAQEIHHLQRPVMEEIQKLREENIQLRELIENKLEERDKDLLAVIREKQADQKKSLWWKFWKSK